MLVKPVTVNEHAAVMHFYRKKKNREFFRYLPNLDLYNAPDKLQALCDSYNLLIGRGSSCNSGYCGLAYLIDNGLNRYSVSVSMLVDCKNKDKCKREFFLYMMHHVFITLRYNKIIMSILSHRTKLIEMLKREAGAKVEGYLEKNCYMDGRFYDEVLLSIFAEEHLYRWIGKKSH